MQLTSNTTRMVQTAMVAVLCPALPCAGQAPEPGDAGERAPSTATAAADLAPAPGAGASQGGQACVQQLFGNLPLYFVENRGQLDEQVAYYVKGADKTLYFTNDGLTISLQGKDQRWTVKLEFVDANPNVVPRAEDKQAAIFSYFIGNDPEKWRAGCPTYSRIVYEDLWPGIDLVFHGTVNKLKHEFIVEPGADPAIIRLAIRGATDGSLDQQGNLVVQTPFGSFQDAAPLAYQASGGCRVEVKAAYDLEERGPEGDVGYGFTLGEFDPSLPLVLDPEMIVYSEFLGGSSTDWAHAIAVDGSGAAYVTGETLSPDFPTWGGLDPSYNGNDDAFIAKVNSAGSALVYSGFLGGSSDESGYGVAVDHSGAAYVTGCTASADFPTQGDLGPNYNGGNWDAFVTEVNAAGSALVFSGFLGGSSGDLGRGIAMDDFGAAYVTGYTASPDFPIVGDLDPSYNGGYADAFVTHVNPAGSALVFSGFLGGSGADGAYGIAVDGSRVAYVTGSTSSYSDFPIVGDLDPSYNGGSGDAFVTKLGTPAQGQGDLIVTAVEPGGPGIAGRPLRVAWDVLNADPEHTIGGGFVDAVYLSSDTLLGYDDHLLAVVVHDDPLGPLESYHAEADVTLPGISPAPHYFLVLTDATQIVWEPNGEDNNLTASDATWIDVEELPLNGSLAGDFADSERRRYYRIVPGGAADLEIQLDDLDDLGINELYVRYEVIPTRSEFDFKDPGAPTADRRVVVPNTQSGTYYVMAVADLLGGIPNDFTLSSVIHQSPEILALTPTSAVNTDLVTFLVDGFRLGDLPGFELQGPEGVVIPAVSNENIETGQAVVTFDLRGVPAGSYTLVGSTIDGGAILTVADGGVEYPWDALLGAELRVAITAPATVRAGEDFNLWVEYENTGWADMVAPLLVIVGPAELTLSIPDGPDTQGTFVTAIADGCEARGILRDGGGGAFAVHVEVPDGLVLDPYEFRLRVVLAHPTVPVDGGDLVDGGRSRRGAKDAPFLREEVNLWFYNAAGELEIVDDYDELNPALHSEIIFHGWLNGTKSDQPREDFPTPDNAEWMRDMGTAIRGVGYPQVVLVDSGPYLNRWNFFEASSLVNVVAVEAAWQLLRCGFVEASNIHFIGHSLGAHVAGRCASLMYNARHVTGLDTAILCGPYLSPDVATYVDHYRTSGLGLAIQQRLGHESFDVRVPTDIRWWGDQHGYACTWYTSTVDGNDPGFGFDHHAPTQGHPTGWIGYVVTGTDTPTGDNLLLDWRARRWVQNPDDLPPEIPAVYEETIIVDVARSYDPNDKIGSVGFGPEAYIGPAAPMMYTIHFENEPDATAAALEVRITDELDPNLDFNTFELLEIGFGPHRLVIPAGLSHFEQMMSIDGWTWSDDEGWHPGETPLALEVRADLDVMTGRVSWSLLASDAQTKLPPEDPYAGFLPPNDAADHRGEGYVSFVIRPIAEVPHGTQIMNGAEIVFDTNPPIATPATLSTIDAIPPTSVIVPTEKVRVRAPGQRHVQWAGTDVGSGVRDYTIFVSEDGGPYLPWLLNTTTTEGWFPVEPGNSYAFRSVARDMVGNVEDAFREKSQGETR
ncbi:MAG: SBBP repeat-containing protein [Planctomycetota bacterium]